MTSSPHFLRTAWRRSALDTPVATHARASALAEAGHAAPPRTTYAASNSLGMRQDGQVLIIFAIFSMVLIGILALSIDAGYLMAERRQVQSAADAGALAAAHAGMTGQNVVTIGKEYGAFNGGVGANAVAVNRPPVSGARAGNNNFVQVTITKPVDRFFIDAVYNGNWSVSATAVAGLVPEGTPGCIFAMNPSAGGISTSGATNIRGNGCSVISNYRITTSGSTSITSSEQVNANDGFHTSGATTIQGTKGSNPTAPEIPDPLAGNISLPTVPSSVNNPVASITPGTTGTCRTYNPWTNPVTYSITAARYTSGNSGCVSIENIPGNQTFEMRSGNWRFDNGAGINVGGGNSGHIVLRGGTWNFSGSNSGIRVGGSTPSFELENGNYSFRQGASIIFGGSSPNNTLGGGNYYFNGGGGLITGGSNRVTLGPGTYIFDGGSGINMTGSDRLHLNSGNYTFYFMDGADWTHSGSSQITFGSNVYVKAYFVGGSGNNWSDFRMSGSTALDLPSGEYYFDHGRFENHGSTVVRGQNVFLYFTDGGYLESTGSASFGFTAPTTSIYSGYFPGVFIFSDPANTATFRWQGSTTSVSQGILYLPSGALVTSGASQAVNFTGQILVNSISTSGSTGIVVNYQEYVSMQTNKIFLVQ